MNGLKKMEKWIFDSFNTINNNINSKKEFEITYNHLFKNDITNYIQNVNSSFELFNMRGFKHQINIGLIIEILNNDINIENSIKSFNHSILDFKGSSFYILDENKIENIFKNGRLINNISWIKYPHRAIVLSKYDALFDEQYSHLYIILLENQNQK